MALNLSDALTDALNEGRHVDEPAANPPWSPVGVTFDEQHINENLRGLMELENFIQELKEMQIPEMLPPQPEQHNFLSMPVQVAGPYPHPQVQQALAAAKGLTAHQQEYENAFQQQANLVAAIDQMQENIDEMAAAWANPQAFADPFGLVSEEEAQQQAENFANIGVMDPISPFAFAPPGFAEAVAQQAAQTAAEQAAEENESTAAGYAAAHDPLGVESFADPDAHAAQVAAHAMANIGLSPEAMTEQEGQQQVANFSNIGISPQAMAALPGVDPFGFVSPQAAMGMQAAMDAVAQQEAAALANLSGMGAEEDTAPAQQVAALDPANPFGFVGPEAMAAFDAAAQQQAANMANIGLSPEAMAEQDAQAQAANMANIGLSPAAMAAAAQQDAYVSALQEAAQVAEQALSPETVAEIDAQIAALAAQTANMPEEQAIETMMEAFNAMMTEAQEDAESAQMSGPMGMSASPAEAMMGMPMGIDAFGFTNDPFSSAQSMPGFADVTGFAGTEGETDDATSPAGIAAASMAAAGFGVDAFGPDSVAGFADPASTVSTADVTAGMDASADDGEGDDSSDAGIGGLGIGVGVDAGMADAAPSDPGADAGADAGAGADADAGAGDAGGSGDAGGGADSPSPDPGNPSSWSTGGRVRGKGLGARRQCKASGGPVGLAAEPPMMEGEKVTKAEAGYQSKPNGREHCGMCAHYMDGACSIVKGRISPDGWSKYFEPA